MRRSSSEPPRRAASNGGSFILLRPLDVEIFNIQRNINTSAFNIYVTAPFTVSVNFSASSGHRKMQHSLLKSSHWTVLNSGSFILLWPLDAEIFDETSTNRNFTTAPFDVSSDISASSGRRRMKPPSFDSSRWAGSNGKNFILLRSLDADYYLLI